MADGTSTQRTLEKHGEQQTFLKAKSTRALTNSLATTACRDEV